MTLGTSLRYCFGGGSGCKTEAIVHDGQYLRNRVHMYLRNVWSIRVLFSSFYEHIKNPAVRMERSEMRRIGLRSPAAWSLERSTER